jgi:hypothetical protein
MPKPILNVDDVKFSPRPADFAPKGELGNKCSSYFRAVARFASVLRRFLFEVVTLLRVHRVDPKLRIKYETRVRGSYGISR